MRTSRDCPWLPVALACAGFPGEFVPELASDADFGQGEEHEGGVGGVFSGSQRAPEPHGSHVPDLGESLGGSSPPSTSDPRYFSEIHEERLVVVTEPPGYEPLKPGLHAAELGRGRPRAG